MPSNNISMRVTKLSKNVRLKLSLVALFLSLLIDSSVAQDASVSKFRAEYPAASARLRQAYSRVRMQGEIDRSDPTSGFVGENVTTILVNGPLKKAIVETFRFDEKQIKHPAFESIYATGKSATFALSRNREETSQFKVNKFNKLDPGGEVPLMDSVLRVYNMTAGIYASAPFESEMFNLVDLCDKSKFRLTSVHNLTLEGRHVVRVGFVANDSGGQRPTGEVDFLPERCWAIQRCQAESRVAAPQLGGDQTFFVKSLMTVEYGGDQAGIPILKRVTFDRSFADKSTFDFDQVELDAVAPDREFTLGFYGLPDLSAPLADPARNNATPWLLGMAMMALVAAIVVWQRRPGR